MTIGDKQHIEVSPTASTSSPGCVGVRRNSVGQNTGAGAAIELQACDGGDSSQRWQPQLLDDSSANGKRVVWKNAHSGLCIELSGNNASNGGKGVALIQDTCNNSNSAQVWKFESGNEGGSLLANTHTGLCMNVSGVFPEPFGSPLIQWDCNGNFKNENFNGVLN